MKHEGFHRQALEIAHRLEVCVAGTESSRIWFDPSRGGPEDRAARSKPPLYAGFLGVALFYAALWRVDGAPAHHAMALATVARFRAQLKRLMADPEQGRKVPFRLGAMVGLGGYLYGFALLSELLDEPALAREGVALAGLVDAERIVGDRALDVAHGVAGTLLGLLALVDVGSSGDDGSKDGRASELLDRARLCGAHLLDNRLASKDDGAGVWLWEKAPRPLGGFAHGAAGIGYALARLAGRAGQPELLAATREAIAWERSLWVESEGNWLDRRNGDEAMFWNGWCHGAPGIVLARSGVFPFFERSDDRRLVEDDIRRGLDRLLDPEPSPVDHVCCGVFGRVDIALSAASALGDPDLGRRARELASRAVERARTEGGFRWEPNQEPGRVVPAFFVGDAGVGYTLLRLIDPSLPSVLALEQPFAERSRKTARSGGVTAAERPVVEELVV